MNREGGSPAERFPIIPAVELAPHAASLAVTFYCSFEGAHVLGKRISG